MSRTHPPKPLAPDDPRHGTYAGYQSEYHSGGNASVCPLCREAERIYQAKRRRSNAYGRPRTVPAIGTIRRIQALMVIGHTGDEIARRLGVTRQNLPASYNRKFVRTDMAKRAVELYADLIRRDGPSVRTRARAEAAGWAAPDQWLGRDMDDPAVQPSAHKYPSIDQVAVERALGGEDLPLTHDEKLALIRRAEQLGIPRNKTMKHLKLNGSNWGALFAEALKGA